MRLTGLLLVLPFLVACSEDPTDPERLVLAGEHVRFIQMQSHGPELLLRDVTLDGEPFGDSVVVVVTGPIRDDNGHTVAPGEIEHGAPVRGRMTSEICFDSDPRQCGLQDLIIELPIAGTD